MHNHLLQEHFLRTFPHEGPGSVNLSLIRKQSLPKEVLGTGRCLKKLRERPGNLKPDSMNSIMPLAHSFSPFSPSSPSLRFSPPLSSFQAPKQKFYPKYPRRTLVKSNNPPTKLQAACFPSQPHLLSFILEVVVFIPLPLRRVLPSLWTFPFQNIFPRK